MICQHEFVEGNVRHYRLCAKCGTYRSEEKCDPSHYWDTAGSTLYQQVWNVDIEIANGCGKNKFIMDRIASERGAALDIGCAPGRLLYHLKHTGSFNNVVGVEPDNHKIIRSIGCFEGKLVSGVFPTNLHLLIGGSFPAFDYICAIDVLEHQIEPQPFLEACRRLLADHGQLFLMLPLADELKVNSKMFSAHEHVWLYSRKHIIELVESAGFQNIMFDKWQEGHDTVSAFKITVETP